jgi:putative FmdB family regulatory protein
MPIYDFACSACHHRFERLQKMSDADPTICPACGLETVSKQVTAPSFRLAGSGWYETDFKKEGDKKKNLADNKVSADKPVTDKPATPASMLKAE